MYGFSVMFRGLEYCMSLAPDMAYFRHPLKQTLFLGQEHSQQKSTHKWSWGGVLARLIEHSRIPREPEKVIDHVIHLRAKVQSQKATWHDLDPAGEEPSLELLETIAHEAELPAKLKDDVIEAISNSFTVGAVLTGPFAPYVSVIFGLGAVALPKFFKGGNVPGAVEQLHFMRATLEWSEVQEELEEMQRPSQES
ncbi:MAG: hypothetical protein NVSMB27_37260 [Ktedonobacteraceae bacterium]